MRAALRLLRPVMAQQRSAVGLLVLWSLVEAAPVMLSGLLVARSVDHGFLAGAPAVGFGLLLVYGVTLLVGGFATRQTMKPLGILVEAARDLLVSRSVSAGLRRAVDLAEAPSSGAVARLVRQTEMARQLLAGLIMTVRGVAFTSAAALIGLQSLLPPVALLTSVALLGAALVLGLSAPLLGRRHRTTLGAEERLSDQATELLTSLRDIAACGGADEATAKVGQAIDANAAAAMAAARLGTVRVAVVAMGARIPLALTLLLGPWLVTDFSATPGTILGVATYLVTGLEPALRSIVGTLGGSGLQLMVILERLAIWSAVPLRPAAGNTSATEHDVRLRGVTFRYGPSSAPVLDQLDLTVPYGDHLAVVGPSGIGKSTLAAILAGLEAPQAGLVTIGGRSVAELAPGWLRREVALVPQESYVFAGSLRENLCYLTAPDLPDGQLDEAIAALGLAPLVARLGGHDAEGLDVATLSEGEKQLITLARVYLSPAHVVVLDEATCHLDPLMEARAEAALAAQGRTLVVIAHRISSALRARRILILDGASTQISDHETLLRENDLYADLVAHWEVQPEQSSGSVVPAHPA